MTAEAPQKDNSLLAFGLVCAAGMSTCIGACAVYNTKLVKLASKKVLAAGLGISAGVMAYVSFIEIFQKSLEEFENYGKTNGFSKKTAYAYATCCFFAGVAMMKLIDALVHFLHHLDKKHMKEKSEKEPMSFPSASQTTCDVDEEAHRQESVIETLAHASCLCISEATAEDSTNANGPCIGPRIGHAITTEDMETIIETAEHEMAEEKNLDSESRKKLVRMGLNTAVAIGIHNFPEGLATFIGTLDSPQVGASLAVAIAIHNIPEGLCVAAPIFYATGNRHKAFLWAFLSGISEPIGAALGWAALSGLDNTLAFALMFGIIAGMMVTIVVYELLPTAHRYDPKDKVVTNSFIIGMVIMALSLVIFEVAEN